MKPIYAVLKSHHNSSEITSSSYLSAEGLYKEIGYDVNSLIKQSPGYANTCATRMSIALIKSSVSFIGRIKIKAGKYAGRSIEPGARLLADQLARPEVLSRPKIFTKPTDAPAYLMGKQGIIFFWKIVGYDGGHIDLVESSNSTQVCNSHCYFSCREIWFWQL